MQTTAWWVGGKGGTSIAWSPSPTTDGLAPPRPPTGSWTEAGRNTRLLFMLI